MKAFQITLAAAALTVVALAPASFAKDKDNTANQAPFAWGMQSGNAGCVIFGESKTTLTENLGASGFATHQVTQLEVIDSIHANLPKQKYAETKESLDTLTALGMQQHLKYVKIPKKYTSDQLQQARTLCGVTQ
jgi:hypothetical protein